VNTLRDGVVTHRGASDIVATVFGLAQGVTRQYKVGGGGGAFYELVSTVGPGEKKTMIFGNFGKKRHVVERGVPRFKRFLKRGEILLMIRFWGGFWPWVGGGVWEERGGRGYMGKSLVLVVFRKM